MLLLDLDDLFKYLKQAFEHRLFPTTEVREEKHIENKFCSCASIKVIQDPRNDGLVTNNEAADDRIA